MTKIKIIVPTTSTSTSGRPVIWDSDPNVTNWDISGAKWDEWYPYGQTKIQGEKPKTIKYDIIKGRVVSIGNIVPKVMKIRGE